MCFLEFGCWFGCLLFFPTCWQIKVAKFRTIKPKQSFKIVLSEVKLLQVIRPFTEMAPTQLLLRYSVEFSWGLLRTEHEDDLACLGQGDTAWLQLGTGTTSGFNCSQRGEYGPDPCKNICDFHRDQTKKNTVSLDLGLHPLSEELWDGLISIARRRFIHLRGNSRRWRWR